MNLYNADCAFCQLCCHDDFPEALQPPLVFEDDRVIVVVDLHRKQYKERFLIITKFGHCSQEELPQEEWDYMIEVAHALGKVRVWKTKEEYEIGTDMSDGSHVHLQVGFSGGNR